MTVTETKQALGSWELRLKPGTPKTVLDQIGFLGHIAIVPGRLNVDQYGDNLLEAARYVGVYMGRSAGADLILRGVGMPYWLGDADGKGDVLESLVSLSGDTFADSVTAVLPPNGAITVGTIHAVPGTYTGQHQYVTPRQALDYITGMFEAEWRVNGTGTLDAGLPGDLYVGTPVALVSRKKAGRDLTLASLSGLLALDTDVEDYTTRVVLIAEGEGGAAAVGSADGPATPFNDIHGNDAVITRIVSETETTSENADTRAQLVLSQFQSSRVGVQLATGEYDVKGDMVVGDTIWVWDPLNGFQDTANEIVWEGERMHPVAVRVTEMQWPVRPEWTVAFRRVDGTWVDLSTHYAGETGQTVIGVGDPPSNLTGIGSEPLQGRAHPDSTIPAAPAFTGFSPGSYQSGTTNTTKSAMAITWTTPLNLDGTTVLDGDHYEIRYRSTAFVGYAVLWADLASFRWGDSPPAGSDWAAPVSDPLLPSNGEWTTVYAGWGTNQVTVYELTPGMDYEFQIRAVDSANPPHNGPWSASTFQTTIGDLFAPSVPAAPEVFGSLISIQVSHELGKATGGTFNLEPDLDHLEVHVGGSPSFACNDGSMVGKLSANASNLGGIPVVGTFPVPQVIASYVKVVAVDRTGNKSGASAAATVTPGLIDNAHISDLTVSKLTAGTLTANVILSASIKTALTGARVELSGDGIEVFDLNGAKTMDVDSATGDVAITGDYRTHGVDGAYIALLTEDPETLAPTITLNPPDFANDDIEALVPAKILMEVNGTLECSLVIRGPLVDESLQPFGGIIEFNSSSGAGGQGSVVNISNNALGGLAEIKLAEVFGGGVILTAENINLNAGGGLGSSGEINFTAHRMSFFGDFLQTAVTRPTVTGSKGGNAALASLLAALASLGLVTDSSS